MRQDLFTKLYVGIFAGIAFMLMVLFYYFTHRTIEAENKAKTITARMSSQAVVDKIDRNFYERYGDVQAFACNTLAVHVLTKRENTAELQQFINQMTQYYVLYDLMMLCDKDGRVVAVNTRNRNNERIATSFLIGKSMIEEDWFRACMWDKKQQAAWFSDFGVNLYAAHVYQNNGHGVGFAAPVKDNTGEIQGVWYNFASWDETAGKILQEAEAELQKADPQAHIFLTGHNGRIIYASNPEFVLSTILTPEQITQGNASFFQKEASYDEFVGEWARGKGAYTFAGNQWNAVTLLSRSHISMQLFLSVEMLTIIGIITLINITMIVSAYTFTQRSIRQVRYMTIIRTVLDQIASGATVRIPAVFKTNDEIGQIGQAISRLAEALKAKAVFSDEIAKGNMATELSDISSEDTLGNSLMNMRNQLKRTRDEQEIQNWTTQGVNQVLELLNNAADITELSHQVIALLIRYLNANQGALFITKTNKEETLLEMTTCYAYGRKKYFEEMAVLRPGQGLAGQAYLEKTYIYLKEVPENYIRITSGLGESVPRCILMMPLLTNEGVEGVIELASMHYLKAYEISFVQKVAENLAFTLRNRKHTQQVVALLEESQMTSEIMQAQEEEMRQNMEEMISIQEDMHRKERETTSLVEGFNKACAIIEFTMDGRIITANSNFLDTMGYSMEELVGKHHRIFVEAEYADSNEYFDLWASLRAGNLHSSTFKRRKKDGSDVWLRATYTPVFTSSGEPSRVIKLAMDITEMYKLQTEIRYKADTMDAYEKEMEKIFRELEMNYELVEAYEEEMKYVFNEMQAYAARLTELEGRPVPPIPVRKPSY